MKNKMYIHCHFISESVQIIWLSGENLDAKQPYSTADPGTVCTVTMPRQKACNVGLISPDRLQQRWNQPRSAIWTNYEPPGMRSPVSLAPR